MSYCRFSSDNYRSDVYVYEHCDGGFMIHVAGNKKIFPPIPDLPLHLIPNFGGEWSQTERKMIYPSRWRQAAAAVVFGFWVRWHRISMWSLRVIPSRPIGLAHDGDSFSDDTAAECAARLIDLRAMGYHIPQHAIDRLREEQAEADNQRQQTGA